MKKISSELLNFVIDYISKNKIKNVDLADININTSLDLDLNLFDLDLDLFLTDFVEKFLIDTSQFNWSSYGYPKGSYIFILVRSLLSYKVPWVKKLARWLYKPKITLKVLQKAIETGVLK